MKKKQQIVAIRPTPIKRDKLRLRFHPDNLVGMFDEFKALFSEENGEGVESIKLMLEDVSIVLKWASKRMKVKEEKVELKQKQDEGI